MTLKHILAELADDLDKKGNLKIANELDQLIREVGELEQLEDKAKTQITCPMCGGSGGSQDAPWCDFCGGLGELPVKEAKLNKMGYIEKRKNKWVILSHKGKTLGEFSSLSAAKKRLREIEYFKNKK